MSQRWVTITLIALAVAAVGTEASRLEGPQGERYVNYMVHWPSDFRAGLEATRALLAGLDPYTQALPDAVASDRFVVGDVAYRYCYPPTHLLLYVPLALARRNNDDAAHLWFYVLLAMIAALAVFVQRLADATTATAPLVIALALVLLVVQPGTQLALERGQSDIVIALLCWAAVLLAQRERYGGAVFVALAAALLKPYPALFALGIVAVAVERRRYRTTLIAIAAALVLLLAPVAKYVPESVRAMGPRAALFWPSWQNWSLMNVAHTLHASFAESGRIVLCLVCVAASVVAWLRLRRALADGDAAARSLWLTLFAICALEPLVGWPRNTYDYAMILVAPGLVALALMQPFVHEHFRLSARARVAAGVWLTILTTAFWAVRPWWKTTTVPLAGVAIVALVVTIGVAAIARPREGS